MSDLANIPRILGGVALAVALATAPAAGQDEIVRWEMNSLLYPKLFGEAADRFAETVERLSGGSLVIEVHDRMVLDHDVFGALEAGLIDAVWGSAGHHHREDPALTIFTGFPFGPDPAGFTAWMQVGGGAEALQEIYARHGLKSVYCGILPAEGGGWFVEPIERAEDFDGLAMRSFGYSDRVLRKLGVVPYELPAREIRPAFETGLIGAAEFSLPSIDADLGIPDAARHLYFPGWQQPATSLEILLPEKSWTALSDRHRAAIDAACGDTLSWTAAEAGAQQVDTLARLKAEGVEFHTWPDDILHRLRAAWEEVIAEDVARDPLLAKAWEDYLRFREGYGGWHSRAHLDWASSAGHAGELQTVED